MDARTLRRLWAPLAVMALIFWLSAQPNLNSGLGVWDEILRKAAHVLIYAVLTVAWTWALAPSLSRPLHFAVALALLYAIADEYHQSFVPGRDADPLDVLVDSCGIAVALAISRRARGRRTARRARERPP